MTGSAPIPSRAQIVPVYHAADWRVVSGANEGDALSFADELALDDIYALNSAARRHKLALRRSPGGLYSVEKPEKTEKKPNQICLDCTMSLMAQDGLFTEAVVLVEVDAFGNAIQVYILPLAPLEPRTEYRLVGIDRENIDATIARVACVSFTRGTRITLATGQQCPIEDLNPGDKVLTRDDGVQPIRWIGQSTQRATGAFAPIRIASGALNNADDLLVSPDHRLLIYQRSDQLGTGRPELLVKAKHLVNGSTVTVHKGGFVDYFQLVFDEHQIIFAEGIAAESMLVDDRTAPLLSAEILERIAPDARHHRELSAMEVQKALLQRDDAIELLRRASKG